MEAVLTKTVTAPGTSLSGDARTLTITLSAGDEALAMSRQQEHVVVEYNGYQGEICYFP